MNQKSETPQLAEPAVELENVSFAYPRREIEVVDNVIQEALHPDEVQQVFAEVTAVLPNAMMSVVGQNGIGKSTLLLLAGGRLYPQKGRIRVFGADTLAFQDAALDPAVEQERNRYVSFVYQNMEFESEESVGELMEYVQENGFVPEPDPGFIRLLARSFEMEGFLHLKTQQLAKGQLQRAIIALSLLYGSRMIMMDEPVFALEEPQKDRVFGFLLDYSRQSGVPIYYSVHNLELTRKYSDYMLLFSREGNFTIGPTQTLYTRESIEEAYQAPLDSLYHRDNLYREVLLRSIAGRPGAPPVSS